MLEVIPFPLGNDHDFCLSCTHNLTSTFPRPSVPQDVWLFHTKRSRTAAVAPHTDTRCPLARYSRKCQSNNTIPGVTSPLCCFCSYFSPATTKLGHFSVFQLFQLTPSPRILLQWMLWSPTEIFTGGPTSSPAWIRQPKWQQCCYNFPTDQWGS